MLAVLLSLGLFAFWGLIGFALLTLLGGRRQSVSKLLLAPAIGAAFLEIILFLFVRSGIPLRLIGVWTTIVLSGASLCLLRIRRPVFPLRRYAPFALIFVAGLFLTGWPILKFGFDWLADGNDDMANYCLGASGFLNHAYAPDFTSDELEGCKDLSRYFWLLYVGGGVRCGSELLLAHASGITGLSTQQAFMSLILALYMLLISSTGGLVYRRSGGRRLALAACSLLTLSPLTSHSVVQQIIAQVGGLALLCATVAVLCRPMWKMSPVMIFKRTLLTSILSTALCIQYMELAPLAALSYVLYLATPLLRGRFDYRSLIHAALAAGTGFALAPAYFLRSFFFLLVQARDGQVVQEYFSYIFPYYLEPAGISKLWGLEALVQHFEEPYESIAIVCGVIMSILCIYGCLQLVRRRFSFAFLGLVMILLGLKLAYTGAAFGLFKIAMFLQPMILAIFAAWWLGKQNRWSRSFGVTVLIACAAMFYSSQQMYIASSAQGTSEVRDGSKTRIVEEIRHHLSSQPVERLVVDTDNNIVAKFVALESRGVETVYPTRNLFTDLTQYTIINGWNVIGGQNIYRDILDHIKQMSPDKSIDLKLPESNSATDHFKRYLPAWINENTPGSYLLGSNGRISILNRYKHPESLQENFFLAPLASVANHAIYFHTDLGNHHYVPQSFDKVSMYQLENDIYYPGSSFAGLGRHVTMMILNPTPRARLLLDMTTTLQPGSNKDLPRAVVIGESRVPLPLNGQGSARVVSDPIEPQDVDGFHFLAIEMSVDGKRFDYQPTGLNKLWKRNLVKDRRFLVGFVRNISVLSEDEYQSWTPPEKLAAFPKDLANPTLEYSGIYEDGWIGKSANLTLNRNDLASSLVIRGNLVDLPNNPSIDQQITIRINGREALHQKIAMGAFELRPTLRDELGRCQIELEFSEVRSIPDPDNRPISIQLLSIGFEKDRSPSVTGHARN